MALLDEGTRVVVVGPKGSKFENGLSEFEIPPHSKGTIVGHEKKNYVVSLGNTTYVFDPIELTTQSEYYLSKISAASHPLLDLPGPVFVIDEVAYIPGGSGSDKYVMNGKETPLKTLAPLLALDTVAINRSANQFKLLKEEYLEDVLGEMTQVNSPSRKARLLSFVMNDVFAYFAGMNFGNSQTVFDKDINAPAVERNHEAFIAFAEKQRKSIIYEQFIAPENLTDVFGTSSWDIELFFRDYNPASFFGKAAMGRNFAIIDGNMFNLSSIDALKGSGVIIKDKTYGIFSPKPLNELTTRMFFEAFRQIKIDAVEGSEEIYHTHMESITGLEKLEALLKVKKHSLGSYGFNYVGNAEDPRYDITLDVPSHILRNPKNKQNCVLFDQTTLAIPVYFEEERITYDTPFCIEKRFKHPFVDNGGICMGGYDSGNLRDLPLAQQVATYILTARQILLTGLNRNTTSNLHSIDSFKRVVDPEDYIHMGIRVTNDAVKSK